MLRKEHRRWWGTRRWWVQALLWLLILNGFMLAIQWVLPGINTPEGDPMIPGDPTENALEYFFSAGSLALIIGVIILAQGLVLDEKVSGTAEWVLSKPITRGAFIGAKLVAFALNMLILLVALPGAIAYAQVSLADSAVTTPAHFLGGLGVLVLVLSFYFTLTVMMGVLADTRGAVLGVAFGLLLGGQLLANFMPFLNRVLPFALPDLAALLSLGAPLPGWGGMSIALTAVWSVVFVCVALWRFQRIEF
jgi:ABC-2 type transport system permease protein